MTRQEVNIDHLSVSYKDETWKATVVDTLKEWGVVVVTDVFSPEESDEHMSYLVNGIQQISPQISVNSFDDMKRTWTDSNVMPQVKKGLHQCGYSFLGWPVRGSPRVSEVFRTVFSGLRGHEVTELVTSIDGINVRPPLPPFNEGHMDDWAHVDQTESSETYECVQGQVVLTNTTASFRCTPKSHLLHKELLTKCNVLGQKGNFYKFPQNLYPELKEAVEALGGQWQIPIVAPKGSLILWLSTTIHSARLAYPVNLKEFVPGEKWKHWRGVVYVCQRPREEVDEKHLQRLQFVLENNFGTNHWGDKLFRYPPPFPKEFPPAENIARYAKSMVSIYDIEGLRPQLTPEQKALIGL